MSDNLAKKSFWSTFWSVLDTACSKICVFLVGIVLARLLTPEDFGLIGMMTVFIALSDVFIESGFSNAIVRKLDRSESDLSSAFFFNVIVGVLSYLFIAILSPYIASFYDEPSLVVLLKYVGLNVVLYSLTIVPNALLIAHFKMKEQAVVNIVANILSGVIAIYLAYNGAGVMALIWQMLILNATKSILFWLAARWLPKFKIDYSSIVYLWNYGSKSLAIGLLGTFFNNLYNIFIGKFFTKTDLGYYSRANQFATLVPNTFNTVIQKVCIATFSAIQTDKERLCKVYQMYMHVMGFVVFPFMFLLALIAKPMIFLLLTDKWMDCVPLLQILSVGLAFGSFGMINICLLNAINEVGYSLKLEITKKTLFVIIMAITFPFGIIPLVTGSTIYNIIATGMNFSCSRRFIGYEYKYQLRDILTYLIPSLFIALCLTPILTIDTTPLIKLLIIIPLYTTLYIVSMFVMRVKALDDIKILYTKLKNK